MTTAQNPLLNPFSPLNLRRIPFETDLGVIPIPRVFTPPVIQTETYLQTSYFEPVYFQVDYEEPVYFELVYNQEQYNEIF